jgi:hypothetical protein
VPAGTPRPAPTISRRRFLALAGVAAGGGLVVVALDLATSAPTGPSTGSAGATAGATTGATPGATGAAGQAAVVPAPSPTPGPRRRYRSRPDLGTPLLDVTTRDTGLSSGLIFLTPANGAGQDGPTIIDDSGELVWMRPDRTGNATNFRVSSWRGKPVLTWWEGANNLGIGAGQHVIADSSYREIARITGGIGRKADLHELVLTARGTALITADTSVASPPVAGQAQPAPPVMDCAILEVDVATGRVLFEWHAVDHIGIDESVATAPTGANQVYDYVHVNSIEVDADGNLIVSARNTSAVYKVDRSSGRIIWRLGGRRSDFAMGPGTTFALQHDARRHPDGTLTIFDDNQAPGISRAITLRLDETAMTATLVRELPQPQRLLATSQGNVQVLPDGNVFVGWGSLPRFSEFDAQGRLIYDASFSATMSYRDFRFPWVGRPVAPPDIAIDRTGSVMTVYASWNGATEVATWDVLAGPGTGSLGRVASAPRTGFETEIQVQSAAPYVAVRARDASGAVLGTSSVVALTA